MSELGGLVFVEPAFEGNQEARVDAAAPMFARNAVHQIAVAKSCSAASENGPILPGSPLSATCVVPADPLLPQALNDMLRAQSLRAGWWTDSYSENLTAIPLTLEEIRTEQRSYGALPLAMVTAENIVPPGAFPPAEERSIGEIMRARRLPLMQLSSRGYQVEARGCSHGDIVSDCADTVVDAIRAVVAVR